jgi:hypothetical protein
MKKKVRVRSKKTSLSHESKEELGLGEAIRKIFGPLGGVTLPEIPREPMREPPDFSDWYPNGKKKRL